MGVFSTWKLNPTATIVWIFVLRTLTFSLVCLFWSKKQESEPALQMLWTAVCTGAQQRAHLLPKPNSSNVCNTMLLLSNPDLFSAADSAGQEQPNVVTSTPKSLESSRETYSQSGRNMWPRKQKASANLFSEFVLLVSGRCFRATLTKTKCYSITPATVRLLTSNPYLAWLMLVVGLSHLFWGLSVQNTLRHLFMHCAYLFSKLHMSLVLLVHALPVWYADAVDAGCLCFHVLVVHWVLCNLMDCVNTDKVVRFWFSHSFHYFCFRQKSSFIKKLFIT